MNACRNLRRTRSLIAAAPLAVFVAMGVMACSSPTQPAAPSGAYVTIAPSLETWPLGETSNLHAYLTLKVGTGADCRSLPVWSSTNPAVVTVSDVGLVQFNAVGSSDVKADFACARATLHVTVTRYVSVGINDEGALVVDGSLRLGHTATLRADARPFGQNPRPCTASWQSSQPTIGSIEGNNSSTVRLTGLSPGQTVITATCDGMSQSTTVRVISGLRVEGTVKETAPIDLFLPFSAEVMDGPSAGTRAAAVGLFHFDDLPMPVRLRISSSGYVPLDVVVPTEAGYLLKDTIVVVNLRLRPVPPPAGTEEFIAEHPDSRNPEHYSFNVTRAGTFRVEAWWQAGEYDDPTDLPLGLRCGDQLMAGTPSAVGVSPGPLKTLDWQVQVPAECELSAGPDRAIPYRIRVTYPH
jgi:hypothetical protein